MEYPFIWILIAQIFSSSVRSLSFQNVNLLELLLEYILEDRDLWEVSCA